MSETENGKQGLKTDTNSTMYNDVFKRVRGVIAQNLGKDPSSITLQTHLEKDLKVDSLDRVDIVLKIEEEFGIEVPEENQNEIQTVDDVVHSVMNTVGENNS